jgi:hypothetical protein
MVLATGVVPWDWQMTVWTSNATNKSQCLPTSLNQALEWGTSGPGRWYLGAPQGPKCRSA